MVFEVWFESDEVGGNSGSVGGKKKGNSLYSLRLGERKEGGDLGNPKERSF